MRITKEDPVSMDKWNGTLDKWNGMWDMWIGMWDTWNGMRDACRWNGIPGNGMGTVWLVIRQRVGITQRCCCPLESSRKCSPSEQLWEGLLLWR